MKKNIPLEYLPFREGGIIRRLGWDAKKTNGRKYTKQTNRFLESHIGKKWDDVYKKICYLSKSNKDYRFLRKEADSEYHVSKNVKYINGIYYDKYCRPLFNNQFFVYNGILLRNKNDS